MKKKLSFIALALLAAALFAAGYDRLRKNRQTAMPDENADKPEAEIPGDEPSGDDAPAPAQEELLGSETPDDVPVGGNTPVEAEDERIEDDEHIVEPMEDEPLEYAEDEDDDGEFTRGVWRNGVFTSKYASVTFRLPEGWEHSSDEDIAELMSVSIDDISRSGAPVSDDMMKLQTIFDMVAESSVTKSSVALMYDNLSSVFGVADYTADSYLEEIRGRLVMLNPALRHTFGGGTWEHTLGGQTYSALDTAPDGAGIRQYYFARRIDDHMLALVISVSEEDSIDDILDNFS